MDNVQPMDGLDFLSLAVTAVVSYLVLFLLTKLVGNKQISQMTMFDYISGISVGSIAAEMATEPGRRCAAHRHGGLRASGLGRHAVDEQSLSPRGGPLRASRSSSTTEERSTASTSSARSSTLSEFLTLCRAGGWFDLSQLETVVFEHNGKPELSAQGGPYRAARSRPISRSRRSRACS